MEVNHLMLARSLVDTASGIIPLRVLNPTDYPCTLYKDTVWDLCTAGKTVALCQVSEEGGAMTAAVKPDSGSPSVPGHLLDLFERSSHQLDPDEGSQLVQLLTEFADTIKVSSDDLGHTSLVTHNQHWIFTANPSASETSPATYESQS